MNEVNLRKILNELKAIRVSVDRMIWIIENVD